MNDSNFGIHLNKYCKCKQRKRNGKLHRYYYFNERGPEVYNKYTTDLNNMENEEMPEPEPAQKIKDEEFENDFWKELLK